MFIIWGFELSCVVLLLFSPRPPPTDFQAFGKFDFPSFHLTINTNLSLLFLRHSHIFRNLRVFSPLFLFNFLTRFLFPSSMAEPKGKLESLRDWVSEHKLRTVGINQLITPLLHFILLISPIDWLIDRLTMFVLFSFFFSFSIWGYGFGL